MCGSARKVSVSHDHQLDKEEDKDGHENDSLHPGVVCDGPSETRISEGIFSRTQKVDEGRRNDNAGAEVFAEEENPFWYFQTRVSFRKDGKGCTDRGSNPDNKQGGYSQTDATVICIPGITGRSHILFLPCDEMCEGLESSHDVSTGAEGLVVRLDGEGGC